MRTASGPLTALLNSSLQLAYADLYTFTLQGGTVIRYTGADKPLTVNSQTFLREPLLKRSRTKLSVGIAVDSLDITASADASVTINSVPFMQFLARGGLDGARLKLERAFMQDWSTAPAGTLVLFAGRVNDVSINRYEASITVQSDLELLDALVPRNLYQPGCMNTLYDGACGKSRAALTVSNAVTSAPAPTATAFGSTLAQAAGYFDLGVVTFTSGQNNGISRTVKSFAAGGLVTLIVPLPFAPAVEDTFTIYPGCDKTQSTCNTKFANLARFRGQPYIPVPETVT